MASLINRSDFTRVKRRVVQILGANESGYNDTVSGSMGAFPYDQEIADAALEADARLITEAYFQNPTLAAGFEQVSDNLASGDNLSPFIGQLHRIELQDADGNWADGIAAQSRDDIINLVNRGQSYLGSANAEGFYFRDGNTLYHSSTVARVHFPQYLKTSELQSFEMHESALIAGTLALLAKHGSPFHSEANFQFWAQFFETQIGRIAMNKDAEELPVGGGAN